MKLTPIKGIFALLVGAIILKIFFPWWFVTLIIGGTTCFALYKWVIAKTGVSPGWAKTLAGAAIFVFCISLLLTYIETKWPWIAKSFDSRQLVTSLGIADWLNPKYPVDLSMKLGKFKELMVKAEEQKYIKKIEAIEAKIAEGKDLSPEDEKVVKEAEEKLKELDKKMSEIHLSRPPSPEKKVSVPSNAEKQNVLPQKQKTNTKYLTFRFPLKAGEPSVDMYVMPSGRPCWADWWGPNETQIINRDGQIMGPLLKEYNSYEFHRGVRFQSPVGGIVIVYQAGRKEDLPSNQEIREIWQKEQEQFLRAIANSPPPKPPELVYLGKELKQLKFRENQYFVRSAQWYIRLMSVGIVDGGKLRLDFLHIASKKGNVLSRPGIVWIENPDEKVFLTDKYGNKSYYVGEKNFGGSKIGRRGPYIGGNELPPEVPCAYSFIFSKPVEDAKELIFVSKYTWCWLFNNNSCMNSETVDVVISNIKLFKEKRLLAEGDVPFEKGEIAHATM